MQWQLWSRHLQWVSTQAQTVSDPQGVGVLIGQYALASGYSAVGLTVRNGGHVQPENVATHLPQMLKGIRSTGCICNHIGTDISPAVDAEDVSWISTQRVHEVLSVASANGIERYRTMTRNFTANTFGAEMQGQLDSLRINHQLLAQINAKYRLNALYHTHSANTLGISVWDMLRVLQGPMQHKSAVGSPNSPLVIGGPDDPIDPRLVALNFAIGHVASQGPNNIWQLALRAAMPYVRGVALHGPQLNRNSTTNAIQNTVVPAPQASLNWVTFFRYLLQGGYNGAAEAQIEFSIVGANGTPVSLNNAFFADNAQFVSGNLTPSIMVSELKKEVDYYKLQALAAGWAAAQWS
jgi:hypothetical protein